VWPRPSPPWARSSRYPAVTDKIPPFSPSKPPFTTSASPGLTPSRPNVTASTRPPARPALLTFAPRLQRSEPYSLSPASLSRGSSEPLARYRTFEQGRWLLSGLALSCVRRPCRAAAPPLAPTRDAQAELLPDSAGLIMLRRGWVVWRPCTTTIEGGRSNASQVRLAWFKLLFAGESLR
jgi:hypothetical protein